MSSSASTQLKACRLFGSECRDWKTEKTKKLPKESLDKTLQEDPQLGLPACTWRQSYKGIPCQITTLTRLEVGFLNSPLRFRAPSGVASTDQIHSRRRRQNRGERVRGLGCWGLAWQFASSAAATACLTASLRLSMIW